MGQALISYGECDIFCAKVCLYLGGEETHN
jgi:hypothetical protein